MIWDQAISQQTLVSQNTISDAYQTHFLEDGSESGYRFGWHIKDQVFWHTGAWLGARTVLIRNTNKRSCIAVLDNSSNAKSFNSIIDKLEAIP